MNIVFYDGDCGLCQRSIRILFLVDKKKIFFFAPINGVTYKNIYGKETEIVNTIKLYTKGRTFERSSAVLRICFLLGGIYRFLFLFILVPSFIRDAIYDQVALRRNKVACYLLQKDERFLN